MLQGQNRGKSFRSAVYRGLFRFFLGACCGLLVGLNWTFCIPSGDPKFPVSVLANGAATAFGCFLSGVVRNRKYRLVACALTSGVIGGSLAFWLIPYSGWVFVWSFFYMVCGVFSGVIAGTCEYKTEKRRPPVGTPRAAE